MSGTVTPSPAAAFSTAPFSDQEKADIRRFCGYPPYGAGANGFNSWRYFQVYGLAEYRMSNLGPAEYQNIRMYLVPLYAQEAAVWTTTDNLDTDKAAVWTHNKNEMSDRNRLLDNTRRKLCALLGLPPGPDLRGYSYDVII